MTREDREIFRCPHCAGDLRWDQFTCSRCSHPFALRDAIVNFIDRSTLRDQNTAQIELHRSLAGEYRERYRHTFARVFSEYWNRQFTSQLPDRVGFPEAQQGDARRGLAPRELILLALADPRPMPDRCGPWHVAASRQAGVEGHRTKSLRGKLAALFEMFLRSQVVQHARFQLGTVGNGQ